MKVSATTILLLLPCGTILTGAFLPAQYAPRRCCYLHQVSNSKEKNHELLIQKQKLLGLIGNPSKDPVLADPITKQPVLISTMGVMLGGEDGPVRFKIQSPTNTYYGSSGTFIDLLEPVDPQPSNNKNLEPPPSPLLENILKQSLAFVLPSFLRAPLVTLTSIGSDGEFFPMRDLFASQAVAYAYERGWRQQFEAGGFPGPSTEAKLAMDYFEPVTKNMVKPVQSVVVDMSCASGE
jgi:hypothetical protein